MTLVVLGGCGAKTPGQDPAAPPKAVVTDLVGRQVEVPVPANKVVAVGPGALRLVCYVNGTDKVAGAENLEKQQPTGRPYILARPELKELPSNGQGGRSRKPKTCPDDTSLRYCLVYAHRRYWYQAGKQG